MIRMICENAKICKKAKCPNKRPHEQRTDCAIGCHNPHGVKGSLCRDVREPIVEKLINHPKYCRFSKQLNGLCNRVVHSSYCKNEEGENLIGEDWECCPRKKQQIPVEIPKASPLDKLLDEAVEIMSEYINVSFTKKDFRQMLEVFAKKVKAL